ncbi:MAG: alpha/beta fold hydrolase [Acidimicrobiia bacterium]|nr:alpha/beta fold hydrolase [Acidimicrobiia bacterium]
MARRRHGCETRRILTCPRRTLALLVSLAIVSCSGSGPEETPTSADTNTTSPATTTTVSATTTTGLGELPDEGPGPEGVEITPPDDGTAATGPAVVLVHGGSWIGGSPRLLDDWAEALASEGAVIFNASYRLARSSEGGYPESIDDIVCAVRFARQRAPEFTESDELIVMGHSSGGHLAAVAALAGDEFGADCPYPKAPLPDRLVGLAAIYDLEVVSMLSVVFMGATLQEMPEAWASANPIDLVDHRNDLETVVIVAGEDRLLPESMAENFASALTPNTDVKIIPGADHLDLQDPETVDLDLVLGD